VSVSTKLAIHRAELGGCRRCALGVGIAPIQSLALSPRVMLVGQAPGQVEAAGGQPFAGRAGRTLFRWFADAGLDEPVVRRSIYIAAVTRCYPGPSASGRGDRVPSEQEQDACAVWLERELQIIRPRVIIPVGKLAIGRFLPAAPLSSTVGRAHKSDLAWKPIVIPLPHPSGASSWIHQGNHPALLRKAILLLEREVAPLVRSRTDPYIEAAS
jgi:uracil-DNA glycosylase